LPIQIERIGTIRSSFTTMPRPKDSPLRFSSSYDHSGNPWTGGVFAGFFPWQVLVFHARLLFGFVYDKLFLLFFVGLL